VIDLHRQRKFLAESLLTAMHARIEREFERSTLAFACERKT